ncbi:MAG: MFS transporter [Ktedonobacterales bacterium]|nr:MFS transporter [Ktedonobacterales bacterium]
MFPDTSSSRFSPHSIWHSSIFLKFWIGQSVSKLGDSFAQLALPLLILQITPNPLALGLAEVAYMVPYLLCGFPAGALMDHLPRRRIMMLCDGIRLGIFALLALLLIAGKLHAGTLWIIYCLQAVNGGATIFFDMGYLTAMPTIVPAPQLLAGNSAMQVSDSTTQLVGPPLAGGGFQLFGAALTLISNAASFAVSLLSLFVIPQEFRSGEIPPRSKLTIASVWREIAVGARFVWKQPVLRWSIVLIGSNNFFTNVNYYVILFRMREQFHFSGGLIGSIYGCLAVGGMVGSMVAGRVGKRLGMLPLTLGIAIVMPLTNLAFVVTTQPWVMMIAEFLLGVGIVVININILTLRQSITPDAMMGRMNSFVRITAWSLIPAGAFFGTFLAIPLGSTTIILGSSVFATLIAGGIFLSPLRRTI